MRTTVNRPASRVSVTPDLIAWVRGLISLAFVLLLPLLVISTSLRGLVTDRELMLRGFRENQVATTTGLDDAQLGRIADLFDGTNEEAVEAARQRWRRAMADGHTLTYWQQTPSGRGRKS